MSGAVVTVLQPSDLDPSDFILDPTSKLVRLVGSGPPALTYTAVGTISAEKAVQYVTSTSVKLADPSMSFIFGGIALNSVTDGQQVELQDQGEISAVGIWNWVPFQAVFITTNGNLTQTPPTSGVSQLIGYATDSTTIRLAPEPQVIIV